MGDEGRTVQAGLKITPTEQGMLSEAFGSAGKALRQFLDAYKAGWLEHPPVPPAHPAIEGEMALLSEQDMANAVALDQVKQSLPIGPDPVLSPGGLPDRGTVPVGHRHRRGEVLSTYWDSGTKKHTWACVVPGCPVALS